MPYEFVLSRQPIVYFLQFDNSFGDAPFYSVLFFFYMAYEEYSPVEYLLCFTDLELYALYQDIDDDIFSLSCSL